MLNPNQKELSENPDVHLYETPASREYKAFTYMDIKFKNITDMISNNTFLQFICEENSDILSYASIVDKESDLNYTIDMGFKIFDSEYIIRFNVITQNINKYNITITCNRSKDNLPENQKVIIDTVTITIKKTSNGTYVEISFINVGDKRPIYIERAPGFLFMKTLVRIKAKLEQNKD
jgi:hypothetical protein